MSEEFQEHGSAQASTPLDPTVDREPPSLTVLYAVLGGLIGVFLFFLPLSTLVGGAVAGYLEGGEYTAGAEVGGLAGGVAFVPFALVLGFVLLFLPAITGLHLGYELSIWVRAPVTVGLAAAYTIGLT